MALDQKFYRYGARRDVIEVEDDTALISRARDVISRATGQLPTVEAGWDHQSQMSLPGGYKPSSYSNVDDDDVRRRIDDSPRDVHGYDEGRYKDDKKNRTRSRRRERRREERKATSDKPCRTILIKHLPSEVDENYLRGILQLFGSPIQDVRLVKHKDSGEMIVGKSQPLFKKWLA